MMLAAALLLALCLLLPMVLMVAPPLALLMLLVPLVAHQAPQAPQALHVGSLSPRQPVLSAAAGTAWEVAGQSLALLLA